MKNAKLGKTQTWNTRGKKKIKHCRLIYESAWHWSSHYPRPGGLGSSLRDAAVLCMALLPLGSPMAHWATLQLKPRASALSWGQRHRKDTDILVLYRGSNGNRSLDIFAICGAHFFSRKQRIAQFTLKMALVMHIDYMCIKVNMK